MTEDYKKILLDYITNLEPNTPTSTEPIKEINEVDKSSWEEYMPNSWYEFKLNGAIKSNTSDKVVFYGGYVESGGTYQDNSKGIIIITDNDLNPIQTIYKFNSGTDLRPIDCMIQEEDGQFVAVDSSSLYGYYSSGRPVYYNGQRRFIMLNDISIPSNDEYQVRLRTSYTFGSNYNNFICKDIYKNPTSSHYFMAGASIDTSSSTYSQRYVKIIDLKVNVGSANEWSTSTTATKYVYGGSYCYFDNSDNAQWKLLVSPITSTDKTIRYWYGTNGTATDSGTIWTPSYKTYIDEASYECQSVFINENLVYFTTNNQRWGVSGSPDTKYVGLYEYNFSTHTLKEIYLKNLGSYDWSYLDLIQLYAVNGELYIEYCTNVDTNNHTADYYVQRYDGDWNPILVKQEGKYIIEYRAFYVSQTFNLLKMYCIPTNPKTTNWGMLEISEIYNIANYNGYPYVDYNSLKPKYVNIYSNNELVFSRNLQNISITNNYTMSTVEIPNTYLNGIDLNPKDLVGETAKILVEDGNTITKNIYEVLYLNYLNTINVKDNDNTIQTNASKYINTNINTGTQTNQSNSKCTKIQINYSDETSKKIPIGWDVIDDTHKSCEFTLYVDKAIASIDFISNDETTTYIQIQRELEVGKYYTFKQYLKVE